MEVLLWCKALLRDPAIFQVARKVQQTFGRSQRRCFASPGDADVGPILGSIFLWACWLFQLTIHTYQVNWVPW